MPWAADPDALDRAISNLIDNAAKWRPPGAPVRVFVADARVEVADAGPGIPDADVPHVFERFYRAPAARGLPGAGLGREIVGRAAQANGGIMDVQTGPSGSAFTLTLQGAGHGEHAEPAPTDTNSTSRAAKYV